MSLSTRVIEELQAVGGQAARMEWQVDHILTRPPYIQTTDTSRHGWGGWRRRVGLQGHRKDEARGFFSRRCRRCHRTVAS